MANRLNDIEVAGNDVAADKRGAEQTVPAGTRGAKIPVRQRPERTKRKDKTANAAQNPEPATKAATSKNTKTALILKKLRTAKGASIEMLIEVTGWQAHSIRGFLSAVVRKRLALDLASEVGKDGMRRYRIAGDTKSA